MPFAYYNKLLFANVRQSWTSKFPQSSPDLFSLILVMLSLLVSVHDNNGHYEEANISQNNQNNWSYEGPNE